MDSLGRSLAEVRRRIEQAAGRSGRSADRVKLIAVSKTVDAERIRALAGHGHGCFGENRVQEALAKIEACGSGLEWHLIGHLQRNKARHAVGVFELIHSVDNEALAVELDRRAERAGLRQKVLVQVNLSAEPTKSGVAADGLSRLAETVAGLAQLDLRGLMTIPPPVENAEESRRWFAALREARDRVQPDVGSLPELSMGMTDDFEIAVEEGATLVRVGRALFGERNF